MPLIPKSDALALEQHLAAHLAGPVTIDYFARASGGLEQSRVLLEEVAALSPLIDLGVHDAEEAHAQGLEQVPSLVLRGSAKGRVRYFGIPAGHEFGAFLGDLIDVARGQTDLAPGTKEALRALDRDVHIRVFVTPTCPFCPGAARLAHKLAVESPRVTADVVDASEFPDLVARYKVHGVPKVVMNDVFEFVGAQPESRFLREVLRAAA